MADIFVSYAREDRSVAADLAKALEQCGWSVWWDRIIPPGKTFDDVIVEELGAARCVIVLWSKAAVASPWVRDEAQEAANHRKLVPATLEGVEPPMGFRRIQAADLDGWRGNTDHPGWQDLKGAVGNLLREPLRLNVKAAADRGAEPPRAPEDVYFPSGLKLPIAKILSIALGGVVNIVLSLVFLQPLGLLPDSIKKVVGPIWAVASFVAATSIGIWVSLKLFSMSRLLSRFEKWRHVLLYCLAAAVFCLSTRGGLVIGTFFAITAAAAWWMARLSSRP